MRTKTIGLTPREKELLRYVELYQMRNGRSPTVAEMRERMHLDSDGFIIHMMKRMEKKGFITTERMARGIGPLPQLKSKLRSEITSIPVLGYVPAGGPVLTDEFVEDWLSVDSNTIKNRKSVFFLRVKGDSMEGVGIMEGDYALVYSKGEPRVGKVVVALVDNENTVKTLKKDAHGRFFLQPENKKYKPIYPEGELQIQGTVIGLFRWYE